ncbi:hypothetical protein FACS189490_05670 [Clostridia bacterium]|nr:hypothetical protein FACS189490_05670 [Clostridia bacterium]
MTLKMTLRMIRTDWIAIKMHHWRLIIMAGIVVFFGISGLTMTTIPVAAYMALAYSVNTFAVEENGKLDSLLLTLPLSRKDIVRGRYVFMGAALLIGLCIGGVVVCIASPNMRLGDLYMGVTVSSVALMCSLGFAFGGFINLCMFPALFHLGYEKGKIWGFYLPLFTMSAVVSAAGVMSNLNAFMPKILNWMTYWGEHTVFVCAVMLGIGAGLMFVSYLLSVWLYERRDV